jgi:hypothetical protein
MSLINEYIEIFKKSGSTALEAELLRLIAAYNKLRSTYLFVYAAAIGKPIPNIALDQADYYMIRDFLSNKGNIKNVEIYIETPGGSGETAEEIVRFLRKHFDTVAFVVSGEAKSAGTLIVLSGDEILMTETGSLGPIDAQMRIGRSVISAYDYMEWVDEKRADAEKNERLNPFDATMVAQITPGELGSVYHALKFAEDLVVEWLVNFKFKKWDKTETRGIPVTDEMKKKRAEDIARELSNHAKWRSHGRSIKIENLEEINLKISRVDDNPKLADIVYRIQMVCRLLFDSTPIYKIFATADSKVFKQAAPASLMGPPFAPPQIPAQKLDVVRIEPQCPKCGVTHKVYAKFVRNPQIDVDFKAQGFTPFPNDGKIKCKCGQEIDLLGVKNQIETQTGRKIVL